MLIYQFCLQAAYMFVADDICREQVKSHMLREEVYFEVSSKSELQTGDIPRGHRPRAQIRIFGPFYFRARHQHDRKRNHYKDRKFC